MFTSKASLLVLCIQCLQVLVFGDDGRERRGLSMLRMGKRDMGYLRMGRSFSLPPLVPPSYDLPDDLEERQLTADDFDIPHIQYSRVPPFPRLGYEEYLNEIRRELGDEPRQIYKQPRIGRYLGRQKRSVDALADTQTDTVENEQEIGESTEHHQTKRALPRFGVRDNPLPRLGMYERAMPFPRLGLYERSFPRLGVREEDENDERSIPMPRLGLRETENELNEKERALPRFGLRDIDEEEEKRAMGMLRMGKRDPEYADKRAMGMLRMGRGMGMLRMGKRSGMSMLRMGRSMGDDAEKRAMGMLRMGRSDNSLLSTDDVEKRAMGMLRMGRAMPMGLRSARGMSMLRMGRSDPSMSDSALDEEKRGGARTLPRNSRGMSMLRMGKRSAEEQDDGADVKRDMGMLRMGKKDQS